ncbi:MAG TPA: glycosyltransferase family 4 protein [Gemmatimonadales bacterium]|nr:glycosyltransferase family 4 protein [Gemmatimonadales bacterium]
MTEPTPILFTHYGEDWIRGSERCLLDLLKHVDRQRYGPIVWCNGPALAREVRALDIPVYQSRFTMLLNWSPPRLDFANYGRLVRQGLRLVRAHGIRLIHSSSGAPNQWLLPIARRTRLPLVTYLMVVYNLRERCTLGLHHATLAVGVSQGCVDGLIDDGMPRNRTKVIYAAVDLDLIGRGDERGLRQRLGIPADAITLTRVGSLIHRKGVDLMLRAFAWLRAERPQCHLLIVGEGPERSRLEALARELGLEGSAHFLGLVDSAGAVLRDATDVAVSPARDEGFGLTVIEAGVFGRPIVATDTPGMREILSDGESGLIVPIGDVPRLMGALKSLVDDPDLRQRLGAAARDTVERRFLLPRYVAEFEATYADLLAKPAGELGWSGPWTSPRVYGRWLGGALRRRLGRGTPNVPADQVATGRAR